MDVSRLKHIIQPYFDNLNYPKGSYDKKNEYILNFILDIYKKDLKYDNAYKQIRLKTSSGNHVNPDNAFVVNKQMIFFDLKTSYLNKKYSSKSEKELLLLASSYDVASYNVINNNDFILKELNGSTEVSDEINEISNVGFFIHFGNKNKIFSDKKNVLNLIDFKYFETTFIFSDFVSLATYNIKLLSGDTLTNDEYKHLNECEKGIVKVLRESFYKSII